MKPIYIILIVIVLILILVYYNKQTTEVVDGGMDGAVNNFVEGPTTGGAEPPTQTKCKETITTIYTTQRKCRKKIDETNVINTHFTKRRGTITRWGDCEIIKKIC